MKHVQFAELIRKNAGLVFAGTLVMVMTCAACSRSSKPTVMSSQSSNPSVRPAVLQTVAQTVSQPAPVAVSRETSPVRPPSSQLIGYRSRDYGVSFLYPWQYAFLSAKTLANGDSSVQPKSDGHDGQFTLARVEIPSGFYPDTDFEDGYFTLSLNQNLSEQDCQATLGVVKDGELQTSTINGTAFHWVESETGGHGEAATLRNYSGFANGTCYELEMGVKTRNERGLAREVDADQVFRRLNRILNTVKIQQATQNVAEPQLKTSMEAPSDSDETE
jgi:hypothetical protein